MQFNAQALLQNSTSALTGTAFNNVTNSTPSQSWDVAALGMDSFAVVGTVDVNTPANKNWSSTGVDTSTDLITTSLATGLTTGLAVTLTTAGSLPTGLATSTTYYVIQTSDTHIFGLADTLAHAIAGTLINLTGTGAGTSAVVVTALVGGSVELQGSADNQNFYTVPNTNQTFTADGVLAPIEVDYPRYQFYRGYVALTSGQVSISPFQVEGRN